MRKAVITENGTALTEVITVTVTSLDQAVNIQVPAAGQTTALPTMRSQLLPAASPAPAAGPARRGLAWAAMSGAMARKARPRG